MAVSGQVRNVVVRGLRSSAAGAPASVLKKEEWTVPFDTASKDVVVKMLAAPVHRHDKWAIQAKYPSLARTGVAGSEGVGVVQDAGAGSSLKKGQHVVFNRQDVGTWADHVVVNSDALDTVPSDIQPEDLSLMNVYGAAYRMVNDYGKIKPDDVCWVIGSGAVATATACLLQQKGATVFVIMRCGRPNEWEAHMNIRRHLANATTVKNSFLSTRVMQTISSDLPKPKFIFNGGGGGAVKEALRFVEDGCKVVSWANSADEAFSVSVGRHIFNDVELHFFWYGRYLANSTPEDRQKMYGEICNMLRSGAHGNSNGSEHQLRSKLYVRAERYAFEQYHEDALTNATMLFSDRKPVLRFGEEYEWTHSGEWFKEMEYFMPKQAQYVEGMSHVFEERHEGEYNAVEAGGRVLGDQFEGLYDTDISRAEREKMTQWDFPVDLWDAMEDTYERYLDVQSAKYNISYQPRRGRGHAAVREVRDTPRLYHDTDPVIMKTLDV